ncbi:hypothetical protein SK128_023532 [Halocaridina rubra]|uniref:Uncharacterized protein n=1 Tax=Halocaridina rubra TaxID=373956 RepID=A0AAN8XAA5_HALRR
MKKTRQQDFIPCLSAILLVNRYRERDAPLNFERLATLSYTREMVTESSSAEHYLLIFFIPSDSSLAALLKSSFPGEKGTQQKNPDEELWETFSHLAAEFSEPGFIFSWLHGDDPLAEKLITAYRLTDYKFNLVAVNWQQSSDNENKNVEDNADIEYGIRVYMCPDMTSKSLRSWLVSLKDGSLQPSEVIRETEWEPRLPGFDYIKFMMEDEDREAEDQLMIEIENDLTNSHHHGEDDGGPLHIHKEL